MTTAEIERRLTRIEEEMAELKARVRSAPAGPNQWIEKIAGTFSSPDDKAAFDEAMRYGRQWREAENRKSLRGGKSTRARKGRK
jgi:hypothetical protein